MKLKTYRAASMADALQAVKKDLGRNAVILHTRTLKVGGILGFRRRTVVEVTASDHAPAMGGMGGGAGRARGSGREAVAAAVESAPALAGRSVADVYVRSGSPVSASAAGRMPESAPARPVMQVVSTAPELVMPMASVPAQPTSAAVPAPVVVAPAAAPVSMPVVVEPVVMPVRERRASAAVDGVAPVVGLGAGAVSNQIRQELADIKLLVSQVLASSPPTDVGAGVLGGALAVGDGPDALFRHYLKLLESQVSREIADRIIARVRGELDESELGDEACVRACVLRQLSSLIPVAEAAPLPMRGGMGAMGGRLAALDGSAKGRPFVVALVGPTGVGKTTTIAKLAATYRLRHGRSVAMITADTYRIAAVDQLRTYASIIGLPLKVVLTPGEMAAAVEAFSSHDVVLIDTAGRSQRNTERLSELSAFLDAAKPDETHLVLSSTVAQEVLLSAADAFKVLSPNRVILTKLDEAVNFGVVVNVMQRLRSKLSFVTMGQEVPDHIEPGRPERLAKLILGGEPLGAGGFADGCSWMRPAAVEVGA